MLSKVFKWIFLAFIGLLILLWLLSGAVGKMISTAESFSNPVSAVSSSSAIDLRASLVNLFTELSKYHLPGQDSVAIPRGPSLSTTKVSSYIASDETQSQEAADFGTPSPYEGQVAIEAYGATAGDPSMEYLEIRNTGYGQIDIAGWSLQSALTGVRMYFPEGTSFFKLGALNPSSDIVLSTGNRAIVTSGFSPVGVSFRENTCTGYLDELQHYTPPLSKECPLPTDSLEETGAGLSILGANCYDYVESLPSCHFPQRVPADLNASCRLFIADNFSYNGCVDTYKNSSSFAGNTWRIYLGSPVELWQNSHDVIRLLDAQGKTVAVTRY